MDSGRAQDRDKAPLRHMPESRASLRHTGLRHQCGLQLLLKSMLRCSLRVTPLTVKPKNDIGKGYHLSPIGVLATSSVSN